MPPTRPRTWLVLLALATASLAPAGALAQSPGAGPGSSPGASPPALDPRVVAELQVALDDPDTVALDEAAHRRAARDALDLAAIDPELPGIMDALDAIAADVLDAYLADPPVPPSAAPSVSPVPGPAGGGGGRPFAMLQTGLNLTWGMASAAAGSFIDSWQPAPGSLTLPGRPGSTSGSFEAGGRFTAYTTTLTDTLAVENGTIRLSYTFEMHSEVLDSATNATLASIDDRGRYAISINPCPVAGGRVDTLIEAASDVTVRRPGGGSGSVREHATATAVTTVTDDAEIGRTVIDLSARRTVDGPGSSDVGFTARYGEGAEPSTAVTQDDGTLDDLQAAGRGAGAAALAGVSRLVDAARTVWRSRCVTVKATPAGREVVPGSETAISVSVRHAVEDRDIAVPVRATLAGSGSIDPDDEPRDAPVDITYRAGLEPRAEATITFRTSSNRGRAERPETYRTMPRFLLDVDGDIDASLGPLKSTYTVTGRGLKVSFGPGDPPSVRVEGKVRIRGRTRDPACRSDYSGSLTLDPDAGVRLVLDGPTPRLSVLLLASDPAATVRVRARCPSGATTSRMPATLLLGVWALGREAAVVELPNGSATIRVARSGPTPKQTWTVTVRPDPAG